MPVHQQNTSISYQQMWLKFVGHVAPGPVFTLSNFATDFGSRISMRTVLVFSNATVMLCLCTGGKVQHPLLSQLPDIQVLPQEFYSQQGTKPFGATLAPWDIKTVKVFLVGQQLLKATLDPLNVQLQSRFYFMSG